MTDPTDNAGAVEAMAAARDALLREAIHMEQDYPGDVPEDCGWWCRLCKGHVEGDRKTGPAAIGHKPSCAIAMLEAALRATPASEADGIERVAATQTDRNIVHRLLADRTFTARRVLPNGKRIFEGAVPYSDVVEAFAAFRRALGTEPAPAVREGEGK